MDAALSPRPIPTRLQLFTAFLKVGVLGFGGVAAWVRHVTVVERGWLSEREFAELFGVASTLPGANTINFATIFGDRAAGLSGAVTALAGLLGLPLLILIGVAVLYARFSGLQDVKAGLAGAAAAAAGLVIGTAVKLLRALAPDIVMVIVVGGVFAAAALAQWPVLIVLGLAIPAGLVTVAIREGRQR